MSTESKWESQDQKSLTESFINYINRKYYRSYLEESEKYEKLNNTLFLIVTIIGFLVTIILGLKEILEMKGVPERVSWILTLIAFILPSISSVILVYMSQKGYKKKEELREEARIQSKYLINEAKLRFAKAKDNQEFADIYQWLNKEIRDLQLSQAKGYFDSHNRNSSDTQD